ncbi:hypothetical protein MRX96_042756 [Rhipicephalus microplus]
MVCGLGLIKGVLCALNFTISLLGVAAIAVAAIVLNNPNLHDVNDHLGKFSNYPTAATFALVAGVTVLLFGVCGCCGACFGVGWLLLMFIIIMAGFVIVETVAMGLVWKYANSSELENTLTSTLYTFIEAKKSGLPNFLHDLQQGLSCCESKSSSTAHHKPVLHTVGCGEAIAIFLGKQSLKIGLLVLGIVVAQVVAISLAVFLYYACDHQDGIKGSVRRTSSTRPRPRWRAYLQLATLSSRAASSSGCSASCCSSWAACCGRIRTYGGSPSTSPCSTTIGRPSVTTLFVGACLLLVGFLGCCGAFFESKRLLVAYNVFMVFFVLLELAIMGLVWKHAKQEAMDRYLSHTFRRLIPKSKNAFVDIEYFLDNVQFKLQCCGGAGPQDYEKLEMDYPGSCFYYDHEKEAAAVYQQGCGREMRRFLMGKSLAVGLVCLFVLLIQLGSIASAVYVLRVSGKPRPKITAV